jgi:hypothetical protein
MRASVQCQCNSCSSWLFRRRGAVSAALGNVLLLLHWKYCKSSLLAAQLTHQWCESRWMTMTSRKRRVCSDCPPDRVRFARSPRVTGNNMSRLHINICHSSSVNWQKCSNLPTSNEEKHFQFCSLYYITGFYNRLTAMLSLQDIWFWKLKYIITFKNVTWPWNFGLWPILNTTSNFIYVVDSSTWWIVAKIRSAYWKGGISLWKRADVVALVWKYGCLEI